MAQPYYFTSYPEAFPSYYAIMFGLSKIIWNLKKAVILLWGKGRKWLMIKFQSFFSPRKWNTWLTLVWRGRNPMAPFGRVLHLSVCNILRRTPCFQWGATVQSWTLESHAKCKEGNGSIILFCCGWSSQKKGGTSVPVLLFELSLCFPGNNSFKMPTYASKNGHKRLPWFQWHSSNRKAVLSTQLFYILAFSLES